VAGTRRRKDAAVRTEVVRAPSTGSARTVTIAAGVTPNASAIALQPREHGHADRPPPPFRAGMVPRPRLVRRLMGCRDTPIAAIVAPAGYGKSTLLAEWAMRDDRSFAWVSLDDQAPDGVDEALRLAESRPQVTVVDDVHLAAPAALRRLVDAAQHLEPGAMVVLAARRPLSARTGRLRAHRLLLEITAADLALTRLEAAMLLDAAGLELNAKQVDELVARTEGWPAALYLATLSLAGADDADAAIAAFNGADRLVAEYVRGELLDGLTEPRRAFLRRTSVLPRLSGPLCDAVLGAEGSTAVLEGLQRGGLPLAPLDRSDTTFRHHPLVADVLRADLLRLEPDLEPELHRRAADWHLLHGRPEHAIPHAVAGHDSERAGRLLWAVAPRHIAEGRGTRLAEWLEGFTDTQRRAHPEIALATAAFHVSEGRGDHAERALPAGDEAAVAMLRACIARHGARQMGADAEQACARAPADSAAQALGSLLRGVAHQLGGESEPARALLEDGVRRAVGDVPVVAGLCHVQLALLAADEDDWDGAAHHAGEAYAMLQAAPTPPAARVLVAAVYAAVAAQRGDIAQARHDAADARRLLPAIDGFAPWLVAEVHAWLARAEIRLSDGPAARMLLARAARAQAQMADAPVLGRWVHDGWERADAFAETATGDGPTLTTAELRVLRLLPSHMSFREIGERLQVSPNTVKTQARSVYRKLNVSRRSGAVSRGRSAGLIDG
jgi:LuxR family maltose regulon positive regulatory protein